MPSKDFKEIFIAELISITGGLIAGATIAFYVDELLIIPGLFILIPGFLEMRNALAGSLTGRLGTALHLGSTEPKVKGNKFAMQNITASFILSIIVALVLATVAYTATYIFFKESSLDLFVIALLAALISNFIENAISLYTTFWLFRKGYDPDNIMGPYITTTGDIISVLSLVVSVAVVLWV